MKNTILITLLLVFISCDKNSQIEGHWHIDINSSDDEELISMDEYVYPMHLSTLDIQNTIGVTNRSSFFLPKSQVKDDYWRNVITLSTEYSNSTILKYKIENDSLFLTDEKLKNKYIGHRVNEGTCDLDNSYFKRYNLDLKIPITSDSTYLIDINEELKNSNLVMIGKPRGLGCFGSELNFIIDGKIGSIKDLESWINIMPKKETNIIKLYADKRLNISLIKEVLLTLEKTKHNKIYFAIKSSDQKDIKWINSRSLSELIDKSENLYSKVSIETNITKSNNGYSWTDELISKQKQIKTTPNTTYK